MLKNVVQNKLVIWSFFLHHCQLQLKNVKNSKLVRHTLKSRTLAAPFEKISKNFNFCLWGMRMQTQLVHFLIKLHFFWKKISWWKMIISRIRFGTFLWILEHILPLLLELFQSKLLFKFLKKKRTYLLSNHILSSFGPLKGKSKVGVIFDPFLNSDFT